MFLQQILNGVAIGLAYAIVAVGYSLVFGILRLINFSHGSVYAFGAQMVALFIGLRFGIAGAIVSSVVLTGCLSILVNKIALEPLRKKKSQAISALITTIGVSYIIQNLLIVAFGAQRNAFPDFMSLGNVQIGTLVIKSTQIVVFAVSLLLLATLTLIVNGTKVGLAMRAVEQNTKAAHLMGINVNAIITVTFFMGGASAAIAGALLGGYYQIVYPTMGFMLGLKAFAASVLGGIGVLHGAIVGGLVVGITESLAATYLGGTYRDVVAFVILILVLIVRPNGLFGKEGINKV